MQDDLYSPQHPGSPFPDAFLSSTSCTSAPLSPPLLDLGVDIQAELEREAPDLDFTLLDPQGKMDLVLLFQSALSPLSFVLFPARLSLLSVTLQTSDFDVNIMHPNQGLKFC